MKKRKTLPWGVAAGIESRAILVAQGVMGLFLVAFFSQMAAA